MPNHQQPLTAKTIKVVSLRLWLPLVVSAIGLLLLVVLLFMQFKSFDRGLGAFVNQTLHDEVLRTQRNLEINYHHQNIAELDYILSELSLNSALEYSILMDAQGQVLVASQPAWKHQTAAEVLAEFPSAKVERALHEQLTTFSLINSQQHLLAIVPVSLSSQADEVPNSHFGALLVQYDLRPKRQELYTVIKQQTLVFVVTMLLLAVIMLLLGHRGVFIPVDALRDSMRNIANGKFHDLVKFTGNGELKALRDELGTMAYELEARTESLQYSEQRFRQLAEASQEVIVFHDGGVVVEVNERFLEFSGYKMEEFVGKPLISFVAPHHQKLTQMRMTKFTKGFWNVDVVIASGEVVPMEVSVSEQQIGGRSLRVVAARDIRDRLSAEEEIRRLSHYDVLTGLANRHYLMKQVALELNEVDRLSLRAALVAMNVNGFKSINDSLGMAAGDEVLRLVARRLSSLLEQGQILARVDGDTFVVLITQLAGSLEEASACAARITEGLLDAMSEPFHISEQEVELSAGAGVVMIPNDSQDPAELLREAETAMHQAKQSEDERVQFFAHGLQEAANERLVLRNDLRSAIQSEQQLLLHYQPQVTATGKLHGVEALVRWQHPQKGLIPPLNFILEAENNGLIVPLGNWVLAEAARTLKHWQQNQENYGWVDGLRMAVNVSPRQFREKDFISRIEDTLAAVGVEALSFELEMTESVVADDLEKTLEKMEQLRKFGVCFALDDFGTGYSSLSYLKRLPISTLKIDRSFVMDIDSNVTEEKYGLKRPAVLIDAIVAMAHQLDITVLAEGVETQAQLDYLRNAGCDFYQGYYFSKPLAASDLPEWAAKIST